MILEHTNRVHIEYEIEFALANPMVALSNWLSILKMHSAVETIEFRNMLFRHDNQFLKYYCCNDISQSLQIAKASPLL
jgi:hypothetical protein